MSSRDQPLDSDAADPRPWERPGAVRKDAAPHRGRLLRGLANASLACGVAPWSSGRRASSACRWRSLPE
jgi:hypothetical protein